MTQLVIQFSHAFASDEGTAGPQFHRYLPSRDDGAVSIQVSRPSGTLHMWFERKGKVSDEGWIGQDYHGDVLELEAVNNQAVLSAGPFFGSFTIEDADDELVAELRLRKFGAPRGLAFAKELLHAIVNPHFVRAVATIRTLLGQYWLEPLYPWDRRDDTIGAFCQHLQMHWRVDNEPYQVFRPAAPEYRTESDSSANPYAYIADEGRWRSVVEAIGAGYEPTLATLALARAHQLRERGEIRLAFVEAVSALEIATSEVVRTTLGNSKMIADAAQSYGGLPFKTKLAFVASFKGIPHSDLELALRGYAIRNEVAHEGRVSAADEADALVGLLRVGQSLCGEPRPLFGRPCHVNERRASTAEWDAIPGPRVRVSFGLSRSTPPGFTDWVDLEA